MEVEEDRVRISRRLCSALRSTTLALALGVCLVVAKQACFLCPLGATLRSVQGLALSVLALPMRIGRLIHMLRVVLLIIRRLILVHLLGIVGDDVF